jgi:hypothetical protein
MGEVPSVVLTESESSKGSAERKGIVARFVDVERMRRCFPRPSPNLTRVPGDKGNIMEGSDSLGSSLLMLEAAVVLTDSRSAATASGSLALSFVDKAREDALRFDIAFVVAVLLSNKWTIANNVKPSLIKCSI